MSKPLESDLKPGMTVLVTTEGDEYLYLGEDTCIGLHEKNGIVRAGGNWNHYTSLSVGMAFYLCRKSQSFTLDKERYGTKFYDSNNPKEVTMSEVEEKFGCKVKIVKD